MICTPALHHSNYSRTRIWIAAVLSFFVAFAPLAEAQQTTASFTPTDDAFVRSSEANRNYGNAGELRVRLSSADFNTYLKFNVTGLTGPVLRATVRLYVIDDSPDGGTIHLVSNNFSGTCTTCGPWTEKILNFNNAPAITGEALSRIGSLTLNTTVEFDVTSAITGDGVFTFAISNEHSTAAVYSSKEGVVAPELVVTIGNPPSFISFSPLSGTIGTEVILRGSYFAGTTSVTFNGVAANFSIDSDFQIRATVPSGATLGPVSLTNQYGTGQSVSVFDVIAQPHIDSFSPTNGAAGTEVTIKGADFAGITNVTFGGAPALNFVYDWDEIRAILPNDAAPGKIAVTNAVGTATSASDFTVDEPHPAITSFTPRIGLVGTEVTITGRNFTSVTQLAFNGMSTNEFVVDSDSQIRAILPSGAVTGSLSVTSDYGLAASSKPFYVKSTGPPMITSFTPSTGPVGTEVTIMGSGFSDAFQVAFNFREADFEVDSDTQMRAKVQAGARTGPIRMRNSVGETTSSSEFTVTGNISSDCDPEDDPEIYSFTPTMGPVGTEVRIQKENFGVVTHVSINGVPAVFSGGRATVPPGATTGLIHVSGVCGGDRSENDFTVVTSSLPFISRFAPGSVLAGTEVAITGVNLTGATSVSFNGRAASDFFIVRDNLIYATAPAGVSPGPISVTNASGTATSAGHFTVTPPTQSSPPMITSFTPSQGPPGTRVFVNGNYFLGLRSVAFNGALGAQPSAPLPTQLQATVPVNATSGPIRVTNGEGTTLSVFNFTVTAPTSPTITSFP